MLAIVQAAMPFSIIGSTEEVQTFDGRTVKGRQYLWGVAEGKSLVFLSHALYHRNGEQERKEKGNVKLTIFFVSPLFSINDP